MGMLRWLPQGREQIRHQQGLIGVAAGTLALSLAACGGGEPEWASGAEAYAEALQEAYATGFTTAAQFYTEDAAFDYRSIGGLAGTGRGGLAQLHRDNFQAQPSSFGGTDNSDLLPLRVDEPIYLSREGVVDPLWDFSMYPELHVASVLFVSDGGISEDIWTGSVRSGELYADIPQADMEAIANDYLAAWAGPDAAALEALYTEQAQLRDSLAGLQLVGRDRLAEAAAAAPQGGGLAGATLRDIPEAGGPALYINGPQSRRPDQIDRLVLLLDVPGDEDCPGQVGVVLWLDADQRIIREERFHRVDAWRRCADQDQLTSGWWDSVITPNPRAFTRTGEVIVNGQRVALWSGTPQREQLLRWALQQFSDAGLPPPIPTSVTFAPFDDDPWGTHGFVKGAPDLVMPDSAEGCPPSGCDPWPADQRALALAELSRRWLVADAPLTAMDEFAQAVGLAWAGSDDPGSAPTADQAAATIAWGLMDEPYPTPESIAERSCEELAEHFATLTRARTAGQACPSPGG
jgi:hypothetical protein